MIAKTESARPRRRRVALGAVVAVLVAAAVTVGLVASTPAPRRGSGHGHGGALPSSRRLSAPAGPPQVVLGGLAFADGRSGWAVGALECTDEAGRTTDCGSTVLATDDGGSTWRHVYRGPGGLSGASSLPGGVVWAWGGACQFGPYGGWVPSPRCRDTLVRSADGGRTWMATTAPAGTDSFAFEDATTGWAASAPCQFLSDGRTQFGLVPAACPATLYVTHDGGRRWTVEARLADPVLALAFGLGELLAVERIPVGGAAESRLAVLAAPAGSPLRIVDPDVADGGQNPQVGLGFSGRTGWIAGDEADACDSAGCALLGPFVTRDGGATWAPLQPPETAFGGASGLGGMAVTTAADGTVAVAPNRDTGTGGAPYLWTDVAGAAGTGWVTTVVNSGRDAAAIDFVDRSHGWLITQTDEGSVILRTADGGRTWNEELPSMWPTAAMEFVTPDEGFGVGSPGDAGAVESTFDGGRTWHQVASFAGESEALSFSDALHGWVLVAAYDAAGTFSGKALWHLEATSDGGRTWTDVPGPSTAAVYEEQPFAVGQRTPTSGVVVGAGGIASTSDAGRTWHLVRAEWVDADVDPALDEGPALVGAAWVGARGGSALLVEGRELSLVPASAGDTSARLRLAATSVPGQIGVGRSTGVTWLWRTDGGSARPASAEVTTGGRWWTVVVPASVAGTALIGVATPTDPAFFESATTAWWTSPAGLFLTVDHGNRWRRLVGPVGP